MSESGHFLFGKLFSDTAMEWPGQERTVLEPYLDFMQRLNGRMTAPAAEPGLAHHFTSATKWRCFLLNQGFNQITGAPSS